MLDKIMAVLHCTTPYNTLNLVSRPTYFLELGPYLSYLGPPTHTPCLKTMPEMRGRAGT